MPSYMEICWVESLAIILTVNGAGKSSPALFPTKVLRIPQYLTENTLLRVEEGLLSTLTTGINQHMPPIF